ncbi:MAG: sulfite exporter TauE/SafE family protein [Verrucomicrobia bacterium]|nr:sulfite exporter TauE/SafE family protein [Verrucomicrobiota bacterium]
MELWTAFLLGLAGSLHCAGMCGPLALALPVTGAGWSSFGSGRVIYNLGRVVTYALLGVLFGMVGKTLAMVGVQRWISLTLGAILLASLLVSRRLALAAPVVRMVAALRQAMGGFLQRRSLTALAVLGLLTGLLPCGLVYVAAMGAAATGGPLTGAGYMAVFGLGTVPLMLAISLSGRLLRPSWRLKLRFVMPVSVFLVGSLLVLRGLALGIPYLSPNLADQEGSCCHGGGTGPSAQSHLAP